MPFDFYEPPEKESQKPDFLEGLELMTSEHISHGALKKEYDGMIIGYTESEHTDPVRAYVTVYVKAKDLEGYVARTYKYKPSINTKGELYRVLDHFGLLESEGFDGLVAKRVKFELVYSQDQNQKYNYIQDSDYIYVNFKVLTSKMDKPEGIIDPVSTSTLVEPEPVAVSPDQVGQSLKESDYLTCRACKKKVTNLLDHMESDCKEYLA